MKISATYTSYTENCHAIYKKNVQKEKKEGIYKTKRLVMNIRKIIVKKIKIQ